VAYCRRLSSFDEGVAVMYRVVDHLARATRSASRATFYNKTPYTFLILVYRMLQTGDSFPRYLCATLYILQALARAAATTTPTPTADTTPRRSLSELGEYLATLPANVVSTLERYCAGICRTDRFEYVVLICEYLVTTSSYADLIENQVVVPPGYDDAEVFPRLVERYVDGLVTGIDEYRRNLTIGNATCNL
jgi:hypothetical protein